MRTTPPTIFDASRYRLNAAEYFRRAAETESPIARARLEGVARELVRTTSLLERVNRELRRKFRQVCCFGSPKGAEVAIFLQVKRLNARWSKQTWWETSQALFFDFLTLHP